VGGDAFYPAGPSYGTAKYHLYIEVHGASRHAFVDRTKKRIFLWMYEKNIPMPSWIEPKRKNIVCMRAQYEIVAAHLDWEVRWEKEDEVEIVFYELPEGFSEYDENLKEGDRTERMRVRFVRDKTSGQFTECPKDGALGVTRRE